MNQLQKQIFKFRLPLKYFMLVFLSIYLVMKGIIPGWTTITTDFPNYYVSAQVIAKGEDPQKLYDNLWFQQQITLNDIDVFGKFSPFPPITSLVMIPIAFLTPINAKRAWLIISLIFMFGSIFLIHKIFSISLLNSSIAMLLMGRALSNDIYYGQLYLMVIFGMLLSLWFMQTKKMYAFAGITLAIITVLKYFPILLIIYALITKKNKVIVSAVATFLALFLFQVLFFGWNLMNYYISDILMSHLSGDLPGQGGFAIAFQSWPSFLNNLFTFHPSMNNTPIMNWSMGKTLFILLIYSSIFITTCWFIFKIQKSTLTSTVKNEWFLLILIVSGLALLPASASYHFLFLLIPLSILLTKKTDVFQIAVICLTIAIVFFPYPFNGTEDIFMLILSYPRLIAINIILMILYLQIKNQLKLSVK